MLQCSQRLRLNLQLTKYALHFQLGTGEITAVCKVLTLLAVLPCVKVNVQLSVSMSWPPAVNTDLKDLSSQRLPKPDLLSRLCTGSTAGKQFPADRLSSSKPACSYQADARTHFLATRDSQRIVSEPHDEISPAVCKSSSDLFLDESLRPPCNPIPRPERSHNSRTAAISNGAERSLAHSMPENMFSDKPIKFSELTRNTLSMNRRAAVN